MSTMIVQDFVVGYALLPVLVDVEAVVAVLAKGLVPEDVQEAAEVALALVLGVAQDVQALATEGAQEVVLVLAPLVLTVVLITAQVVAAEDVKQGVKTVVIRAAIQDVREDVT